MSRVRLLSEVPLPGDWAEQAACRGYPTQAFFPPGGTHLPEWFIELCADCPVLPYCRHYALHYPVLGLWAGLSEEARVQWRREHRRAS